MDKENIFVWAKREKERMEKKLENKNIFGLFVDLNDVSADDAYDMGFVAGLEKLLSKLD